MNPSTSPGSRRLILNADDFGMCHATNAAIIRALEFGLIRSTTLMVPCAWALHGMHYLAAHPQIPFGVHLTVLCDGPDYRWGPLSPRDKVPTLVDETGTFYRFERMAEFFARARLDELEREFRAQVETVLAAGLAPTHLDWHSLRLSGHDDIFDLMARLARDYGLALRVMGRPIIEKLQATGLPTIDHDFLDSYFIEPADKPAGFTRLLRDLPPGLSEWAIHPGLANDELRAIEPAGAAYRQADLDFFTSPQTKDLFNQSGVTLLDYRPLQEVWKKK